MSNDKKEQDLLKDHVHDEEPMFTDDEIVILEMEEGDVECGILAVFGIEDQEYIALLPLDEEHILVYRYYGGTDDGFELGSIETEEEYNMVREVFETLFYEEEEDL